MVRVQQGKNQIWITIPKDVAEQAKIKKGEDVTVVPDQYDRDLIIKRRR